MVALPTPAPPSPPPIPTGWPWPPDHEPTLAEVDAICPEYAAAWRWLVDAITRRELGLGPTDALPYAWPAASHAARQAPA